MNVLPTDILEVLVIEPKFIDDERGFFAETFNAKRYAAYGIRGPFVQDTHGFVVLSETADRFYKCDEIYSPADELTVRWNDPALGIQWGVDAPILSVRDAAAPLLAEISRLPKYGQV